MKTSNGKPAYRIFIVEDNDLYAKVLKRQLENDQFEVFVFYNGRDCLDNLEKSPDVITLDYTLPDMNGDLILKEIKKRLPSVHVIIISGQNDINTAVGSIKKRCLRLSYQRARHQGKAKSYHSQHLSIGSVANGKRKPQGSRT
jgi:DNA-binding NtrC family response regulator